MSTLLLRACGFCIGASALLTPLAHAHVTLLERQAPVSAGYRAVFKVPHGCDGSATTKLRIRIPEGVIGVRPMPKAGWEVSTTKGNYKQSYSLYGSTISEGVQEVTWEGGPLLDEHYDEFILNTHLSDALTPNSILYFPVIQECETGVERWIDVPKEHDNSHFDYPAPGLQLLPSVPTP